MINFLHGKLVEALPTQVTVDVQGVGYEVLIPLSSFDKLPQPGGEVKLLTHLAIREDAHILYGFMSPAEREMFRLLIHTVSGIGPKIALNILSGMNVTALRGAVANGDVKSLSQISGVGKKTAERIVVELKDKMGASGAWEAMSAQRALSEDDQKINDAMLALMALGFKQVEAHDSVRAAMAMLGAKASVEDLVRASLKKGSVMPEPVKKSSAVVVPHAPKWYQRLAAWIIYAAIQSVSATLRYRWVDESGFFKGEPPGATIYCVWHNRMILSMKSYYSYIKQRNRSQGLALMVSASKDGGFLSGVFECFSVQPVRGSTSRRGHQALRELTTWAKRDYDLAITPDGPRGPCYVVQVGVISLAQLTGRPIVPVSFNPRWKLQTKSWDRFQGPLPFSQCDMIFGQPVHVPREADDAEREKLRLELERELMRLTKD